jgi:hypothetical protein
LLVGSRQDLSISCLHPVLPDLVRVDELVDGARRCYIHGVNDKPDPVCQLEPGSDKLSVHRSPGEYTALRVILKIIIADFTRQVPLDYVGVQVRRPSLSQVTRAL